MNLLLLILWKILPIWLEIVQLSLIRIRIVQSHYFFALYQLILHWLKEWRFSQVEWMNYLLNWLLTALSIVSRFALAEYNWLLLCLTLKEIVGEGKNEIFVTWQWLSLMSEVHLYYYWVHVYEYHWKDVEFLDQILKKNFS